MRGKLLDNIQSKVKLTDRDVEYISRVWKEKSLRKNEFLFRNGQVCSFDSYVVSGALKAFYIHPETGKEEILFFAIEDWWATDLESFANRTSSIYNIQAIEDSVLLQIHLESFEKMLEEIPKLERYFRIILQGYVSSIQKRIVHSNAYDAEHRHREFARKYPKIIQKIPQYLIASYLGISPEFLSRIRARKS